MGETNMVRKKKGRPSKADVSVRRSVTDGLSENELRRSRRRRNPTYHDDFYEDDEEEDDEDERKEKKLKLVLKLPHKADFGGVDGVDSSSNLTRTEGNVAHASPAVSASSSDNGDGNKPFKKRKIDDDNGAYDEGEGDDAACYEDDAHSIGSDHRKKVCDIEITNSLQRAYEYPLSGSSSSSGNGRRESREIGGSGVSSVGVPLVQCPAQPISTSFRYFYFTLSVGCH